MTKVLRIDEASVRPDSEEIQQVARILLDGGLALIPTETVYGIGVAVSAQQAFPATASEPRVNGCPVPGPQSGYRRIFDLKQRDLVQTVPWLVSGAEDLDVYGHNVDPKTRVLARLMWPGALTLIVPAASSVPAYMQAADGTVALRASASPIVAALARACGCPLATTSANTHGRPAPSSFDEVEPRVLAGVDVAIDAGPTACRDASTIVSFPSGHLKIIRQGALPATEIEHAVMRSDVSEPRAGSER